MSKVENLFCDECHGMLPHKNTFSLGITDVEFSLGVDLKYCGANHDVPKRSDMRFRNPAPLDFCNLECLTSWLAYKVTEHFMEHCEGESDKNTIP